MLYIKVGWSHQHPMEPVVIYSELDESGWENRKVEVFRDGYMTFADENESSGNSGLSETPIPDIALINENPRLAPEEIDQNEFEAVWKEAKDHATR